MLASVLHRIADAKSSDRTSALHIAWLLRAVCWSAHSRDFSVRLVGPAPLQIALLKTLSHPYIVQLHEVMTSLIKVYIVLELVMGKDLSEIMNEMGPFPEGMARCFFQQLVDVVNYCHAMNIIHRDLKVSRVEVPNSLDQEMRGRDAGLLPTEFLAQSCMLLRMVQRTVV